MIKAVYAIMTGNRDEYENPDYRMEHPGDILTMFPIRQYPAYKNRRGENVVTMVRKIEPCR